MVVLLTPSVGGNYRLRYVCMVGVKMKRTVTVFLSSVLLMLVCAMHSTAQVKRVQMHIAGYLCGN